MVGYLLKTTVEMGNWLQTIVFASLDQVTGVTPGKYNNSPKRVKQGAGLTPGVINPFGACHFLLYDCAVNVTGKGRQRDDFILSATSYNCLPL